MIQNTQQGLETALQFKLKMGLSLDYLPAKSIAEMNDKAAFLLSTAVSAMANANGGTIFVGVKTARNKPQSLNPFSDSVIFDWACMVCQTQISPAIPDCRLEKIEVSSSGDFVIGIHVPNSHLAPHICSDHRFYKRVETKAVLMEEYEIRNLYNKGKRACIEFFSVSNTGGIPIMAGGKFEKVNFYPRFLITNTGGMVEQFYKVELSVPSALNNPNFNNIQDNFSHFNDGNSVYVFAGKTALFQGEICPAVEPNFMVEASTYKTFDEGEIVLKFYYSAGVETKIFRCKELLLYRNKQIELVDFQQETRALRR